MFGLRKLLGLEGGGDNFDGYDEYVPSTLPGPGWFLSGHDVLVGDEHVQFHRTTRDIFEERELYDVSFDYNMARLNLDTRHPNAGFRYAVEAGSPSVLRAELTPKTEFCPQTLTITKGAFRAWNGVSESHEYDLVRIRVDRMHYKADAINDILRQQEESYLQFTGGPDSPSGEPSAETEGTSGAAEPTRSEPPF
ncbi:hypothetical protein [Haloarcula laminariae]|uniref:hypothetical protein n=1 Tax=Haloarcula laminariae TaxID=2961577 RepID=UPI0021C6DFAE|nr:hypothetical protein [Halomicroarcula laminariae]